jgi:streptogramin lyase
MARLPRLLVGERHPHQTIPSRPRGAGDLRLAVSAVASLLAMAAAFEPASAEPICYVSGVGRISAVRLSDGQRAVASGLNLPGSGLIVADPNTGDIYDTDQTDRAVYRIENASGFVTMVSGLGKGQGPNFSGFLFGITQGGDGSLYAGDGRTSSTGGGMFGIFRIDPLTGDRTVISGGSNCAFPRGTGPNLKTPFGLAVEGSGSLLVADPTANTIVRIDPATGNRTIISGDPFGQNVGTGPDLHQPKGIGVRSDASLDVIDESLTQTSTDPGLFRVDQSTGNRMKLSNIPTKGSEVISLVERAQGGFCIAWSDATVLGPVAGTLLEVDQNGNGVVSSTSVAPSDKDNGLGLSEFPPYGNGPGFLKPIGIAMDLQDQPIVMDAFSNALYRVNLTTADRSLLPNSRTGQGVDINVTRGILPLPGGSLAVTTSVSLIKIERTTGNRTLLSAGSNADIQRGSGSNFGALTGLTLDQNGMIVVGDAGGGNPKIARIDPISGNRTIISDSSTGAGPSLQSPYALAVEAGGNILVTDTGLIALLRVNPITGDRAILSSSSRGRARHSAGRLASCCFLMVLSWWQIPPLFTKLILSRVIARLFRMRPAGRGLFSVS